MAKHVNQRKASQHQIIFREPIWNDDENEYDTHVVQIPTTKAAVDEHYRPINAFRKRQQEHGRCVCPKESRLLCNMDCATCPFHRGGDELSLDYTQTDECGNEISWQENIADDAPSVQSIIEDSELLDALYTQLSELAPDAAQICEQIMKGSTERAAAAALKLPRNTYVHRRDKVLSAMRKALESYV